MSNLINGFSDYKSICDFFRKEAKKMKNEGIADINGSTLLNRFCKADGVKDRRTLKHLMNKKNNEDQFLYIDSYDDLNNLLIKNDYDFSLLNSYFHNTTSESFYILGEPNYDEPHECFNINTERGQILFGEVEKATYFTKHIKTNGKKYFVTIDGNPMVGEDCELIPENTRTSNSFRLLVKYVRSLVNGNYLNEIDDSHFVQLVRSNDDILNLMLKHWEETDGEPFKDNEVIPLVKSVLNFDREISDEMFNDIKAYLNEHLFFSIVGYHTLEEFENNSSDNGDDIANGFYFYFEALDFITSELFEEYYCFWIRSDDSEVTKLITKENYKK